jgi:Glycosyl transferases group 1
LIVRTTDDVLMALDSSDVELNSIGAAARERTLAQHTAEHRAAELEALLS